MAAQNVPGIFCTSSEIYGRPNPSPGTSNPGLSGPNLPFVYQEVRRLTLAARVRSAAGPRAVSLSAREGMVTLSWACPGGQGPRSNPVRPSRQTPSPRNFFAGTTVDELE